MEWKAVSKTATCGILSPEDLGAGVDALEIGGVVQGRQVRAFLDLLQDVGVDADGLGELLGPVNDPVADGVEVVPAVDACDLRPRVLHPGLDPHDGRPVIRNRFHGLKRSAAVGLEGDDGFLGPDLLDQSLGDALVSVGLEEFEVGIDDLELDGGTAAIEDEYVHECHLPYGNKRL